MSQILVIYDTRSGNTEQLAQALVDGVTTIDGVSTILKKSDTVTSDDIKAADAVAIGSPSHFSIMSGRILTLLTDLYASRDDLAGKPLAIFTTGSGSQVTALENLEKIIGAFNPQFIKPGIAVGSPISDTDKQQVSKLGRRLAKAVVQK